MDEASSSEPSRAPQCNDEEAHASLQRAPCPSIRKHSGNESFRMLSKIDMQHEKSAPVLLSTARQDLRVLFARSVRVPRSALKVWSRRAGLPPRHLAWQALLREYSDGLATRDITPTKPRQSTRQIGRGGKSGPSSFRRGIR